MSNLKPGEFDVGGVRGKKVSFSHLAIPVLDVERSIAFQQFGAPAGVAVEVPA